MKHYSKDNYSDGERLELTNAYSKSTIIKDHQLIEGTVVNLSNREVFLNIGYKSDAIVLRSEFRYNPDLKIGDKVDLFVESKEDTNGLLVLSHKKARFMKSWQLITDANKTQEIVNGMIKSQTNRGYIVDLFGIEAFLPGSQVSSTPIYDESFVGKTIELKVIKINEEIKNVIVSHKLVIENDIKAKKSAFIAKLKKGQIVEGTVKNITNYGVFVDLGGVDGLIYITDLCYKRIKHPSEIVELNQKINVVILSTENDKVSLSFKLIK